MKIITTILIMCCSFMSAQQLKSKPSQKKVCKCNKKKEKPSKPVHYTNNKTANKRPKWDKKPEKF